MNAITFLINSYWCLFPMTDPFCNSHPVCGRHSEKKGQLWGSHFPRDKDKDILIYLKQPWHCWPLIALMMSGDFPSERTEVPPSHQVGDALLPLPSSSLAKHALYVHLLYGISHRICHFRNFGWTMWYPPRLCNGSCTSQPQDTSIQQRTLQTRHGLLIDVIRVINVIDLIDLLDLIRLMWLIWLVDWCCSIDIWNGGWLLVDVSSITVVNREDPK